MRRKRLIIVDALVILANLGKPELAERSVAYLVDYLGGLIEGVLLTAHYCPGCTLIWECNFDGCNVPVEMLCDACDTEEIREELGGKWLD
jgi:hypothetical protein